MSSTTIRAVFFDFGGVIARTEFQTPRQELAERLRLSYDDLVSLVFGSESSLQASLGEISVDQHWEAIAQRLGLPVSDMEWVRKEFFAGDIFDRQLIDFIRSLRPHFKTGLLSNAWSDMRDYLISQGLDQAFDTLVISAEVGLVKPDPSIYRLALKKLGVTPEQAVFVDDFPENVAGAQSIGMHAIQFHEQEETLARLRKLLQLNGA
jgi:epoxide hydrolase-like predicted phosphatase